MKTNSKNNSVKYFYILLLFLFYQGTAFAERYPDVITAFSGAATYCQDDGASPLSVTFTTCKSGNGTQTNITVTWYSNTTNSTTGGTQVHSEGSNTSITTFTYTPSTSNTGTLYYYVEISWAGGGSCNGPSPLSTSTFTPSTQAVTVNPPAPATPGAISGQNTVSQTTSYDYSINPVPNATTYNWSVPTGWTINSGDGTTTINVTSGATGQNGDIQVSAQNDCGTSAASTLGVIVQGIDCPVSTAITPSAIQTLCQDDASNILTAAITTSGGSGTPLLLYQWYYNSTNSNTVSGATIISGATNSTYTPLTTASELGSRWYFCVGYSVSVGCGQTDADQSLASNAVEVTVEPPPPATPGTISGTTPVAPSTGGFIYSIDPVTDATTYTWTVPSGWTIDSGQGTTSISVTSGIVGEDGNITVTAGNSCGTSAASSFAVTVEDVQPSDCPSSTSVTPTGIQTLCVDDPASQLTSAITTSGGTGTPTLQYQWYYNTSNSNTVAGATLIAGATISTYTPLSSALELGSRWYFCVGYATDNGCAQTNATQSLASNAVEVTVITTPATPGAITGSDNVSPSTSGLVYSITAVPTADSYTWTVPTGWTINSGQGSNSISVTSGTLGQDGDITVTATNSCGTSAASVKAVTVTQVTFPPTITLGSNPTVCQGTTTADLTYSATTESPDQYSIDYNATAEAQGFIDVINASLPVSPIILDVPGGAANGTYYGNLTVRNSTSGLSSSNYSISVTIITTPATPGPISGFVTVNENTPYSYSVASVPDATTYTWTVPTGWSITAGQGTSNISVTSGSAGQNGDITVTAGNTCGSSATSTLAVSSVVAVDHSNYTCNACHILHNAPGGALTAVAGNANLCISCHNPSGLANGKTLSNADKAIPGTGGTSHAWDVLAINSTYETNTPSDPEMVLRIDGGNIICSTCHDQHNANTNPSYIRSYSTVDALCKDCHSARDVGRYADDNTNHKGSHPVGLVYPSGNDDYNDPPTGSVTIPGGNIECSSCHQTHYSTSTDGYLLRQTNDDALCAECHTFGSHNSMGCKTCHQTHNTNKANVYMIKDNIVTPNSGTKTVVFTALTGTNSFADGDGTYDGICEVCHTSTTHFMNDGTATDQNHSSVGGAAGVNCVGCHPHNANFSPAGGSCDDCHNAQAPTFGSAVHVKHKDTYGYNCSTCHFGYGSGGSSEPTHPSGSININFDPNGLATRNGQDANTPGWSEPNCSDIYCHSDGRSAYRGTDGTYTWSGTTGSQTATYTDPAWNGSITTCDACHSGTGNMTDPYTITTPGLADPSPPSTGSHLRGAHKSNSQENDGNGWSAVNCFWCHNPSPPTNGDDGSPILQGTYGTPYHVDGATYFDPRSVVNGGTILNNPSGGTFSYAYAGSSAHCGAGKSCW